MTSRAFCRIATRMDVVENANLKQNQLVPSREDLMLLLWVPSCQGFACQGLAVLPALAAKTFKIESMMTGAGAEVPLFEIASLDSR
jgi:hypothetical protein